MEKQNPATDDGRMVLVLVLVVPIACTGKRGTTMFGHGKHPESLLQSSALNTSWSKSLSLDSGAECGMFVVLTSILKTLALRE